MRVPLRVLTARTDGFGDVSLPACWQSSNFAGLLSPATTGTPHHLLLLFFVTKAKRRCGAPGHTQALDDRSSLDKASAARATAKSCLWRAILAQTRSFPPAPPTTMPTTGA